MFLPKFGSELLNLVKLACRVQIWKKKFVKIVTTLVPTTYVYVFTLYLQETHYFKPI